MSEHGARSWRNSPLATRWYVCRMASRLSVTLTSAGRGAISRPGRNGGSRMPDRRHAFWRLGPILTGGQPDHLRGRRHAGARTGQRLSGRQGNPGRRGRSRRLQSTTDLVERSCLRQVAADLCADARRMHQPRRRHRARRLRRGSQSPSQVGAGRLRRSIGCSREDLPGIGPSVLRSGDPSGGLQHHDQQPVLPTLVPGTVYTYHAPHSVVTVTVTNDTAKIDGVTCRVVRDTNVVDGKVAEDTLDW